jgi:hypothetical protein
MSSASWLREPIGSYFTRGTLLIPLAWIVLAIFIPVCTGGWSRLIHDGGLVLASISWFSVFAFGLHFFRRVEALIDRSVKNGLINEERAGRYRQLLRGSRPKLQKTANAGSRRFSYSEFAASLVPFWIPAGLGVLIWGVLMVYVAGSFTAYPLFESPYSGGFTLAQHYGSLPYLLFFGVYGLALIVLWFSAVVRIPIATLLIRDICVHWKSAWTAQDRTIYPSPKPGITSPLDRRFKIEVKELSSVLFATQFAPAIPFVLYFPILWTQSNGFSLGLGPDYLLTLGLSYSLLVLPGLVAMSYYIHTTINSIRVETRDFVTEELDRLQGEVDLSGKPLLNVDRIAQLTKDEEALDDLPSWFLNKRNLRDVLILLAGAGLGLLTTALSSGTHW